MATEKFDLSVILRFVNKATPGIAKFTKDMRSMGRSITDVGKTMSMRMTLPIVALGGFALKSAIDMETAFTGVQKTVNGTAEELALLKEQIKGLSLKIPLSTTELFGVAEAAGQLGIKTKNIVDFTKVMADLGATTDLSSRDAATALAKFVNITGSGQGNFDRLGSTIVALGNNMATTESKIVDMGLRLAGAGKTVGLTDQQIFALAATLSSLGLEAQLGGSAFSMILKKIDKEIGTSSEKMDTFALIAGKSTKEFEKAWKDNAADAVLEFMKGLNKAEKAGVNINKGLDELGFTGLRVSDVLLRLKNASKLSTDAQDLANKSYKENNALQKEAALRYKTTASQLKLFKNNINLLGDSFGKEMLPALNSILIELRPFIDMLKELSPEMKRNIIGIAAIFAVGGPIIVGLGVMTIAIGALLSPIGLVLLAFVGWGVAIGLVVTHLDEIKEFFRASPAMAKLLTTGASTALAGPIAGPVLGAIASTIAQVNIKVEAAEGTRSTVEGVQTNGAANVQVVNKSDVGLTVTPFGEGFQ